MAHLLLSQDFPIRFKRKVKFPDFGFVYFSPKGGNAVPVMYCTAETKVLMELETENNTTGGGVSEGANRETRKQETEKNSVLSLLVNRRVCQAPEHWLELMQRLTEVLQDVSLILRAISAPTSPGVR
jgi:hypothetical protein